MAKNKLNLKNCRSGRQADGLVKKALILEGGKKGTVKSNKFVTSIKTKLYVSGYK